MNIHKHNILFTILVVSDTSFIHFPTIREMSTLPGSLLLPQGHVPRFHWRGESPLLFAFISIKQVIKTHHNTRTLWPNVH